MTDNAQRIVSDYLAAVDNAARDLPPDRRVELVTDLAEHIAAARVELAPETGAGLREILDRLGDPHAIATEASIQLGLPPAVPARAPVTVPAAAGRAAAVAVPPPAQTSKVGTWLIAVIAVLFTAMLAVCCIGAGVYALSGDRNGPVQAPGDSVRPRPALPSPG
jgi:uncharacterized membrane protein